MSQTNLISLVGQDREQLAASMSSIGVSESQIRMRVNQLYHWIYERGVSDFDAMLNLSKSWERRATNRCRDGLHSGAGARNVMRLKSGWMLSYVYVLPHRHAEDGS